MLRGADLVHARSDLAAGSAMLARNRRWVWDVRSLFADQRIALGTVRAGSAEERALRAIEATAARRSSAITALSAAAIDVLSARYGDEVRRKAHVVPTCVDLDRFAALDLPPLEPAVELLISGTLNSYYDLPTMLSVVDAVRAIVPATVEIAAPGATGWDDLVRSRGLQVGAVEPGLMAERVGRAHAGLSICRFDAGPSLAAAVPTKVAEFLAVGRPVVVNAGLGDFDTLLPGSGAGVVLADSRPASVRRAAEQLMALLSDPETPQRCRRLAAESFDVSRGVQVLRDVYARISR
jgi:glycosyltransferase involved in cell wall biosynthesis